MQNPTEYRKMDLYIACIANAINIVMVFLFLARFFDNFLWQRLFGFIAMVMGFSLAYIAFMNRRDNREKWETILLIPIILFFSVELILDYILVLDFHNTIIIWPYILLYHIGLWGLIGYVFRFEKKCGFITLITYFLNMIFSILPYIPF